MTEAHQKSEQAVKALLGVGLSSAKYDGQGRVVLSPEDAMKMLLLTEKDGDKLLEFSERARQSIKSEVERVRVRLERLEALAAHSPELCLKGEHIHDSRVTGGKRGHVLTTCLACNYHVDGYD